jgi:hypothetical protein
MFRPNFPPSPVQLGRIGPFGPRFGYKGKNTPLNDANHRILRKANDDLTKLRDEEMKWARCAKVKHVQEGDNNTKYFHLIANRKHRRKKYFS